jgi:translation initiation factor 3 subunit E
MVFGCDKGDGAAYTYLRPVMASRHDLTTTLSQFLDPHQVLQLLEFLEERKMYKAQDIRKAKLDLVSKTKMLDFAMGQFKELYPDKEVPAGMHTRKEAVIKELETTQAACGPFVAALEKLCPPDTEDDAKRQKAQKEVDSLDARNLQTDIGASDENVEALFAYAKLNFDCGRYQLAACALKIFRQLSADEEQKFWALWGKLAAETIMQNEVALDDLKELRELITKRENDKANAQSATSHLERLQQRTWLMHWSLFIFCNMENATGLTSLIEYFNNEFYTIQTNCPHVIRYLVAAVIISKSRKTHLNDTIKLLASQDGTYNDPITQFLSAVCRDYDFNLCQKLLAESEQVVLGDYFLNEFHEQFLEGARLLVFEYYCRIHKCVQIDSLAKVLYGEEKCSDEETENKIVELIRDSGINARVDAEKRELEMNNKAQVRTSVYQQVIEKTKSKAFDRRTRELLETIDKKCQ